MFRFEKQMEACQREHFPNLLDLFQVSILKEPTESV